MAQPSSDITTGGSGTGQQGLERGIDILGLRHEYVDTDRGLNVLAIDGLDLRVEDGELVTILGPSGCGKSTLLYIIAGLVKPTAGTITVGGKRVTRPGPDRGMVFQDFAIMPWRTVARNVAHGLELQKIPKTKRAEIVSRFVKLVGLEGFEDEYPHKLSGGMRQRVAVARTLAADPLVILMDEPFAAVDAQTRITLQEELLSIAKKTGKTMLFVTHNVEEAVFLGDRVVVISNRPGHVKESVKVDLDRSEGSWGAVSAQAAYGEIRDHVLASVRAEVSTDE